jgi:leucyl-tRNA synthetase
MDPYDPKKIEEKWQKQWLEHKVFKANDDSSKLKYYQLETFPYPSADGLHVGHPKGFTAEDIHARYMRMHGKEVLYTMGWDAFGLPTENFAIKVGKNPKEVAQKSMDNFRRQVRMFGFSYDWDREINTSSPDYYRWTQWLFIQLYKKGLAYQAKSKVNWCPKDQTVLANEQVVDGKCERCGSVIEERDMTQWFLRITKYTDRLLADLKGLDWPASTIKRQEDWIGKSEGAEISFALDFKKNPADNDRRGPNGEKAALAVFTTRPDTLFGATYLVLAPEHLWVTLAIDADHDVLLNKEEVAAYVEAAKHKTELMRKEGEKEKTGVEIKGVKAINPATGEEISIWVADYVLGSYGTGAIMAVPAHDERDFAFAKKFNLPIRQVISGSQKNDVDEAYTGDGTLINSGKFNDLKSEDAKWQIAEMVGATKKTQYKLRDWSVSRQRYWGVPIPMIHCEKCGIVPVPESELPVLLPDLVDYRPKGMPPLASSPEFINVKCPKCSGDAKRDAETLDTFVDSSWYFLRYTDPHDAEKIFDPAKANHWMPVDLYVIGAEHTVLHLLYSRFITKFLHDEGLITFQEPFMKLRHQGLIRGTDGKKMSKSVGNVVNPDEVVGEFGADTVRLYLMFMGPFEDGAPWDPKSMLGVERFLKRFWNYANTIIEVQMKYNNEIATDPLKKPIINKTIKKVGGDIEEFKFNTAISALMILINDLYNSNGATDDVSGTLAMVDRKHLESIIKIIHPLAPHMAQELWERSGHDTYLDFEAWPGYDEALLKEEKIKLILQVNGKVRDAADVDPSITEEQAKEFALSNAHIQRAMNGARAKKIIYVDKKLVNIVV